MFPCRGGHLHGPMLRGVFEGVNLPKARPADFTGRATVSPPVRYSTGGPGAKGADAVLIAPKGGCGALGTGTAGCVLLGWGTARFLL